MFQDVTVELQKVYVLFEDYLLLKLMQFFGVGSTDFSPGDLDESSDAQRSRIAVAHFQTTRYYFGSINISSLAIRVSLFTSKDLPPDLVAVKNAARVKLIGFEDVPCSLGSYQMTHIFETQEQLLKMLASHYKRVLQSDPSFLLLLLGSFDVFGNVKGFVTDISGGAVELMQGNLTGGISRLGAGTFNTASKVTNFLHSVSSLTGCRHVL